MTCRSFLVFFFVLLLLVMMLVLLFSISKLLHQCQCRERVKKKQFIQYCELSSVVFHRKSNREKFLRISSKTICSYNLFVSIIKKYKLEKKKERFIFIIKPEK